ncbi:MAG: hypothetical protein U9O97_06200 [Elusimicrobiota bacterium]|nr:hypothetical protein [Elusimicrobiota bacterium]
MKNKTVKLLAVLLTLISAASVVSAGFFYAKEPYALWGFSPGYKIGDKTYFIANYTIKHRPKGIARFPDGGISKTVFARTYFCSFDFLKNKLDILSELGDKRLPGGIQGGVVCLDAKFRLKKDVLYTAYKTKNYISKAGGEYDMFSWDMKKRLLVKIPPERKDYFFEKNSGGRDADKRPKLLRAYKVHRLLEGISLEEWGLPPLLDYCKKSRRAYMKDLVLLRGPREYRKSLMDKYGSGFSEKEIKSMLGKMEKRKNKLKSYQRLKYETTGAWTREALEELLKNK